MAATVSPYGWKASTSAALPARAELLRGSIWAGLVSGTGNVDAASRALAVVHGGRELEMLARAMSSELHEASSARDATPGRPVIYD